MFLDQYPELDRVKIYQYFSKMNNVIRNAIDEIVREDARLNGIDVTSRGAECKSSHI